MEIYSDKTFLSRASKSSPEPLTDPQPLPPFFVAEREKIILIIDDNKKFLKQILRRLTQPNHDYKTINVKLDRHSSTLVKSGTTVMLTTNFDAAEKVVAHNSNLNVLLLGDTLRDQFRRTSIQLAKIAEKRPNLEAIYSFSNDPLLSVRLAEARFSQSSGRGGGLLRDATEVIKALEAHEGENLNLRRAWERPFARQKPPSLVMS